VTNGRMASVIALAALAALSVGCSGGSAGPAVARAGASPSRPSGGGMVAFAACMRSHGVPDFPDSGKLPPGIDPNSPQYQAAQDACQSLLPVGGGKQFDTAQQKAFIEFSACVRAHGVPNFPDPIFPATGGAQLPNVAGLDPSSPRVAAAMQACQRYLPNRGRGRRVVHP
jgi:hypothetical protein